MILNIPEPTSLIVDLFTHTIATINIYTSGPCFNAVTITILPEDLVDRPIITIQSQGNTDNFYYSLILMTGPNHEIRVQSRHLDLLHFYLNSILTNESVTIDDTKTKFPELFI